MVRRVFTLSALLIACVSTVSALPAHPRGKTDVGCAPSQVRALGPNGVSVCSPPSAQTLERRGPPKPPKTPAQKTASKKRATAKKKAAGVKVPTNRKARAKARVAKGQPKATAKDRGRVPGKPKTKPKPPMSPKKKAKVAERKEDRKLGKQQKFAGKIADARQKQKAPPYGMDASGKLRKPEESDMSKKAWTDKQAAKTAKAGRTAAYNALSPEDKAKKQSASATKQATKQAADKAGNVKEKNRQNRIKTKATANTQRKAENRKNANTAKAAYKDAVGMPSRGDKFTSPKGNVYNGKDVRQAVFAGEHAKAKGGVGFNGVTGKEAKNKDKVPKDFGNRPNDDGSTPLPGVTGGGLKEFPILHDKKNGHDGRRPAPTAERIITKTNAAGKTELVGKVGHGATGDDHHSF